MPIKKIIKYGSVFFFGIFIALLIFFIALPSVIEYLLKDRLPPLLQSDRINLSIDDIGISHTSVSGITMGEGLRIDSVVIDYDIQSITQIKVSKITISGLNLEAEVDDEKNFNIPGVPLTGRSHSENSGRSPALKGFLPEKIVVRNSRVKLKMPHKEFLIPFECLATITPDQNKIMAQARLFPFGDEVISNLTFDFEKGIEFVRVEARELSLDPLGAYLQSSATPYPFPGRLDFILESFSPEKSWNLSVSKIGPIDPYNLSIEAIRCGVLIDGRHVTAKGSFQLAHPFLQPNEMTYEINIDASEKIQSEFLIHTGPVTVETEFLKAVFPQTAILGEVFFDETNNANARVLIKSSQGNVQSSRYKVQASGIALEIPIHFPNPDKPPVGKFSIPSLVYDKQYGLGISGTIFQADKDKIRLAGKLSSKILPAVQTQFKAFIDLKNNIQAEADIETNRFKLSYADIKKWMPKGQPPFELDLKVSAKGTMNYLDHHMDTRLSLDVDNGRIRIPELDVTADGIHTRIELNDLLVPETVPGQILTIQSVQAKKIGISDAVVQFSLEDAKTLLIENIKFKWCNGLISTEAVRFPQASNEYHLTLFCDRLELTGLLKQMGAFHAEGDGTLNGRIPIVYSNGKISFKNGFLFSTPGSKGRIMIENTDRIIAGIPMDSPQFSQLDVAREALRDFNYEWAKLTLNSQGDTLMVNMQLDGKPARLLPFEYKKEFGGFVRVDASSPGSHFQGIALDVNLNLPFNDIVKFGNQLNTLLNK